MTDEQLQVIIAQAAERGAQRALQRVGLSDEDAGKDIHDLRDLIDGWRSMKKTVGTTITKMITTALLAALAMGAWMKWGGGAN